MFKADFLKNVYLFRHKSIFVKFLVTSLVLIIVPMLTVSIIYMNVSLNSIQKEILSSDEILLNRLSDLINENVNNVEQLVINVLLQSDISPAVLSSNPEYIKYTLDKTRQGLSKIIISNKLVDDVFVYYKSTDTIVTSNVIYDFDVFFRDLHKYEKYDLGWWVDYFNNNKYKEHNIIPSSDIFETFGNRTDLSKTIVTFVRGLNQFQDDPQVVYGIIIKESAVINLMDQLNITKDGFVYIVDSSGNIVTTTDKGQILSEYISHNYKTINTSDKKVAKKLDNQKFNMILSNSSGYGLSFIAVIPSKEVVNKNGYVRGVFIYLSIITIIIAVIIAIITSGNMYRPINKLIELFEKTKKEDSNGDRNEFEYISSNIADIINDTKNLDTVLKKSLPFSRETLLINLIKGRYSFLNENPDILKEFGIFLVHSNFIVLLIKIDNYKSVKSRYNEIEFELLKYGISQICEEELYPDGICFFNADDEMCLIVSLADYDKSIKEIIKSAFAIKQNIINSLSFTVTIGIGTVKKDIHDICKSYNEALDALKFRKISGGDEVIEYEQIPLINAEYYFPLDREKSIINFLKAGDYENSIKTIEQIIMENYGKNIPYYYLHYIQSELLSALLKTVYEVGGDIHDIFNVNSNLHDNLYENDTIEDILSWFEKVCNRLCNYVMEQRESNNMGMINKIKCYIIENYNKDITLESVSDHFDMSYSYLSRYFKQQMGVNFIDYLYQLRIEKAKEMLKNSSKKIVQISESVGFYNVNNFIRMFKKYEGITPGKFKDSLC